MQYFISKNGQQLGPFAPEQIRIRLASGELSNTDLAWCEGMNSWESVGSLLNNPYLPQVVLASHPPMVSSAIPAPIPESDAVTALAVISVILGAIGLLGSFIPCLGALAIYPAVPAAVCGAAAYYLARRKKCSTGFPLVAFIISALAIVISGFQILMLNSAGKAMQEQVEKLERERRAADSHPEISTPESR